MLKNWKKVEKTNILNFCKKKFKIEKIEKKIEKKVEKVEYFF